MIGPVEQRGSINKERGDKLNNLCGREEDTDNYHLWNIKATFGDRSLVSKPIHAAKSLLHCLCSCHRVAMNGSSCLVPYFSATPYCQGCEVR